MKSLRKQTQMVCLDCGWTGTKRQAKWIDMSGYADDTYCSGQKKSGMHECRQCGGLVVPLNLISKPIEQGFVEVSKERRMKK